MKNQPSPSAKKRVAIVDDHTLMRQGIKTLVDSHPDLTVAWMASSVGDALSTLDTDVPDLMTVDITLPGRNGLELVKDALAQHPGLFILVVSMHDEALYAQRVLKAGAKGYIMKDAPDEQLLSALHRVAHGGLWVSPAMSEIILELFSGSAPQRPADGVQRLSDREFEVFQLLGEGKNTQHIADSLNISPKTVDVHKAHIREKLEVPDSSALLSYAIRWTETQRLGRES
jgi:DNA-binding NarL/FixJ family response regulator